MVVSSHSRRSYKFATSNKNHSPDTDDTTESETTSTTISKFLHDNADSSHGDGDCESVFMTESVITEAYSATSTSTSKSRRHQRSQRLGSKTRKSHHGTTTSTTRHKSRTQGFDDTRSVLSATSSSSHEDRHERSTGTTFSTEELSHSCNRSNKIESGGYIKSAEGRWIRSPVRQFTRTFGPDKQDIGGHYQAGPNHGKKGNSMKDSYSYQVEDEKPTVIYPSNHSSGRSVRSKRSSIECKASERKSPDSLFLSTRQAAAEASTERVFSKKFSDRALQVPRSGSVDDTFASNDTKSKSKGKKLRSRSVSPRRGLAGWLASTSNRSKQDNDDTGVSVAQSVKTDTKLKPTSYLSDFTLRKTKMPKAYSPEQPKKKSTSEDFEFEVEKTAGDTNTDSYLQLTLTPISKKKKTIEKPSDAPRTSSPKKDRRSNNSNETTRGSQPSPRRTSTPVKHKRVDSNNDSTRSTPRSLRSGGSNNDNRCNYPSPLRSRRATSPHSLWRSDRFPELVVL